MKTSSFALQSSSLSKGFVDKVSKRNNDAVSHVSIDVAPGSLTALVGPDGAGKTTFLRMAAGLIQPDSGSLHVLGIDVQQDPQAVQDRISYMPQRFGLYEDLSVQENLDLYADLHGVPGRERSSRFARLLDMTNLGPFSQRLAGQLSGGMKQKLGLACTLVRAPELLLLDEPTVGVDPLSRRELWAIVQQLVNDQGLTVVLSTAYLDEAERCQQVILMREGKVLAHGDPNFLRHHAEGRCFIATPPAGTSARLFQALLMDDTASIVDAVPQAGEVRFIRQLTNPASHPIASLVDAKIRSVPAKLEDGFMVLLHQSQPANSPVAMPALPAQRPPTLLDTQRETVIEVHDLVRKFGDFVAVANTTFKVQKGEVFGLLGPNGAGKTTTFRMLCGLLPATSGTLSVAGVNLRQANANARRHIGYVSQKFALYGNLNVWENLKFFAGAYGLRGRDADARIHLVMDQFELGGLRNTSTGQLPGGFKQRLAMAAALLHQPQILFLDEPTSGTDPLARREFWHRITALAEQGTTIVVTTHFMEEAEYCDRIVIQDAGRVLAIGTPREVREKASAATQTPLESVGMEEAFIGIVLQARAAEVKPAMQAVAA